MTERRLPPALEEKAWMLPMDAGGQAGRDVIALSDLLDWLYGADRCQVCEDASIDQHTAAHDLTPGLVERVEERLPAWGDPEYVHEVLRALRAELAAEASEALDRFTAVTPDDTARYAHSEDPRFTGGVTG